MATYLRPKSHTLGALVFSALLLAGFVLWLEDQRREAVRQVENEDRAHALLRGLGDAQRAHLAATGRYGWIPDLRAAGLLPAAAVETENDGTHWLRTPGYRIDVLLPTGRDGEGRVELGRADERASRTLQKRHFAVVARPLVPRTSGYRIYYLDERGEMYLSDLVSDERGSARNPLPRLHKSDEDPGAGDGLVWVREAHLQAQLAEEDD